MTMEWPQHSYFHLIEDNDHRVVFKHLLDDFPDGLPEAGMGHIDALLRKELHYHEVLDALQQFLPDNLETELDPRDFLVALGLIQALVRKPLLETWLNVRTAKEHLRELSSWLATFAVQYVAAVSPSSRTPLVQLAQSAIAALDDGTLPSMSERRAEGRGQLESYLAHHEPSLVDAFRGLNWSDNGLYSDEFTLYQILRQLDFDAFCHCAGMITNPMLLDTVLWSSGATDEFHSWARMVALAPTAFDQNGAWENSLFLPRLTHYAVSAICSYDIEPLPKNELQQLIAAIVQQFYFRTDHVGLLGHWATDILRSLVLHDFAEINQPGKQDHIFGLILEAIGRCAAAPIAQILECGNHPSSSWNRFLLQNFWAAEKIIDPISQQRWFDLWSLKPDEWLRAKGRALQYAGAEFVGYRRSMPAGVAQLIIQPLIMESSPPKAWQSWWCSCQTLREMTEFGSPDAGEKGRYGIQADTSRLLLIAASTGLALIDTLVSKNEESALQMAAELHTYVSSACREMLMIDPTLAADDWNRLWKNLVVRRLMWESQPGTSKGLVVFEADSQPSAAAYLVNSKSDVRELLGIIDMALANNVTGKYLLRVFAEASIELGELLSQNVRLSEISPKKYPPNRSQQNNFTEAGLLH